MLPIARASAAARSSGLISTPSAAITSRLSIPIAEKMEPPAELVDHNCLIYGDMTEWPFTGQEGRFSVPVSGNLSSNSAETILAGVLAGVGIGMFHRASLVGEFQHPDVITVLDDFIDGPRDVSLVWPKRRFVPTRVRRATDFFAVTLPLRI